MSPLETELLDALKLAYAIIRGRHSSLTPANIPAFSIYRIHSPEIQLIEAAIARAEPTGASADPEKEPLRVRTFNLGPGIAPCIKDLATARDDLDVPEFLRRAEEGGDVRIEKVNP